MTKLSIKVDPLNYNQRMRLEDTIRGELPPHEADSTVKRFSNAVEMWLEGELSYGEKVSRTQSYENELDPKGEGVETLWDKVRIGGQGLRIFEMMASSPHSWFSLRELAEYTNIPEASVSAALRSFRRKENGAHKVHRRRVQGENFFEYQLEVNGEAEAYKKYTRGEIARIKQQAYQTTIPV